MRFLPSLIHISCLIVVFWMVSASLNVFQSGMFDMHDLTQVGRIESYVLNLRSGQFPPRIAPEFSYNLGFPVFNFYAPTAYILTSLPVLLGVSSVIAVKLSFLCAIIIAFLSMRYLLSLWMHPLSSIIGAFVYVTSTYFAVEILIRGNLAECWFLALFPFGIGLLVKNTREVSFKISILTPIILALLFLTHNMLGLFAILISIGFALCLPEKGRSIVSIGLAICLSSFFFLPAFAEGTLVQARTVAKEYSYAEHFLCVSQIWTAKDWGFGGSVPGCEHDSMSFKLGKVQILFGVAGLVLFGHALIRKEHLPENTLALLWTAFFSLSAMVLTIEFSKPFWNLFSGVMALFQFPWRFLVFCMFGIAVFAGFLVDRLHPLVRTVLFLPLVIIMVIPARKYFIKPMRSYEEYEKKYASLDYRQRYVAYNMREYIHKDVDYPYWNTLNPATHPDVRAGFEYMEPIESSQVYIIKKNTPFEKEVIVNTTGEIRLNIHAFPHWQITMNDHLVIPLRVDRLARPIVAVSPGDEIKIRYEQTEIEKFANFLSVFSMLLILFGAGGARFQSRVGNDIH